MAVRNKNLNYRRSNRDQFKKKCNDKKDTKPRTEKKPCTRFGRTFGEGHLKSCPAMGKTCKSCSKRNHFAKLCRSNQVNEITEENSSSEEECNLLHSFDSCDEFEIKVVEPRLNNSTGKLIEKIISGVNDNKEIKATKDVRKIDIRRDPKSHQIKALKALVRMNNQIINMTIDTGSPVSFLNWTMAKQLQRFNSSQLKN